MGRFGWQMRELALSRKSGLSKEIVELGWEDWAGKGESRAWMERVDWQRRI